MYDFYIFWLIRYFFLVVCDNDKINRWVIRAGVNEVGEVPWVRAIPAGEDGDGNLSTVHNVHFKMDSKALKFLELIFFQKTLIRYPVVFLPQQKFRS